MMNQLQPIHDTFNVLAGGAVRRAARPGEQFERAEKHSPARRKWSPVRQLLSSLLLKLQH